MAKTIRQKKKTVSTTIHRRSAKQKEEPSEALSGQNSNLAINMKASTPGEKGTEFHLSLGDKEPNKKSKLAGEESSGLHLYVGSKGGDKHGAKAEDSKGK